MSADPSGWPEGVCRVVLSEVDSTNAEGARRAAELAGPTWLLARRQLAGRGRRGRAWHDPDGNFAATLVMRPPGGPPDAALRSFVAALALHDALAAATGRKAAFALKWPNDVLLNGGKVAGILLEALADGCLLVGIGVNLHAAPPMEASDGAVPPPVALLSETGVRIAPEPFLDLLAPAFARWEARLRDYGFDPLRCAFLDRAARRGEAVTARTGRETITGTFSDLDSSGAIVLTTARGPVKVTAADIFF